MTDRHSYEVAFYADSVLNACDWRWPAEVPVWTMSSREGNRWFDDGPLTEKGRQELIKHFGLSDIADEWPLVEIREASPFVLVTARRALETERGLERHECASTKIGDHIVAEQAA